MKVLCIGNASYDITFPLDKFPQENTKNRVPSRVECGGGPASNAAYLLGKWGIETYFIGSVGNDYYGNKIKNEFDEIGVSTKYLELKDGFSTPVSMIIANKENGSRTILTYRDNNLKTSDINIDFKPDIILIDGQEYELSKKLINTYPDAITIIDAGRSRDEIIELSKMVKYLVCSKEFAENVTKTTIDINNSESLITTYKKMQEIFNNTIVITLEDKGSLYEFDNVIKIMPSIKVTPIDSTGAGDIFHGAFTYGIAKNLPFEETIMIANIAGALSVTKVGGRFSISSKEEMKAVYGKFE